MASEQTDKHIRVPERVHDHIKALKRDDETMGEAVERLISKYTLTDFADETTPTEDERALDEAYDTYVDELEQTMVADEWQT